MNLNCCICIFVITHFVFGNSNEKSNEESNINKLSHTKSGPDGSNSVALVEGPQKLSEETTRYDRDSVAVDEPEANDEDADAEADKGGDGDDKELSLSESPSPHSAYLLHRDSGESFPFRKGVVLYYVDRDSYDEIIVDRIVSATKIIEKESCIQFVRIKDKDEVNKHGQNYLHFVNLDKERECVHSVSRGVEGEPTFILGYDCMQTRDIIHALMHLLGFGDEVTHPLRDSYIRVVWENIQPKYRHLFLVKKLKKYYKVDEYDMMSIMQFYPTAYSTNGAPTIVPLTPGELIMPSDKLSLLDKMKLRSAFRHECNRRKVSKLLGTCINAVQGDDTAGCTSGETDNGGESSKFKSRVSSESDKNINIIGIGEDKNESLTGSDNDKIKTLSGSDKDRIEVLSGTDRDKKEALSGSDTDKIQVLSGTDKDRIEDLSGGETDKVGSSKIRLSKNENQKDKFNIDINKINKKTSIASYLRSYRKYMY